MKRYRTSRRINRMVTSSTVAFPTHFAAIATSGTIAIDGSKIAIRLFLLTADIISWMQAIGIRPGAMILLTAITITTARSTPTVTCCLIR